jgi:hypothetical protein
MSKEVFGLAAGHAAAVSKNFDSDKVLIKSCRVAVHAESKMSPLVSRCYLVESPETLQPERIQT